MPASLDRPPTSGTREPASVKHDGVRRIPNRSTGNPRWGSTVRRGRSRTGVGGRADPSNRPTLNEQVLIRD